MADPIISEKHERTIRVAFDHREVKELMVKAALRSANIESIDSASEVTVKFEDQTAGSPPYRVGTLASVTIVIDLAPPAPATALTEG